MTKEELIYANINGLRICLKPNTIYLCQEKYIPHYDEIRANGDVSRPCWIISPPDGVRFENMEMRSISSYGFALALIREPGAVEYLSMNDCDIFEPDVAIQSLEVIL